MEQPGMMKTLACLRDAIRRREMSSREAVEACINAIRAVDPRIRAFVSFDGDRAVDQAEQIDRRLAAGEDVGPLAGVPVALKDNICTHFGCTTCASKILAGFTSPYDAHVTERLERAGAI
ncbi:MAG: amidase family protein, partial [Phycisphaerae bacterium]